MQAFYKWPAKFARGWWALCVGPVGDAVLSFPSSRVKVWWNRLQPFPLSSPSEPLKGWDGVASCSLGDRGVTPGPRPAWLRGLRLRWPSSSSFWCLGAASLLRLPRPAPPPPLPTTPHRCPFLERGGLSDCPGAGAGARRPAGSTGVRSEEGWAAAASGPGPGPGRPALGPQLTQAERAPGGAPLMTTSRLELLYCHISLFLINILRWISILEVLII